MTYITASQPKWDPRFLSDQTRSFATATAPIVHLTRADLKPTLNANDLDCIDAVIAKDPSMRRKLPQPGVRELVFTERDLRPSIDFFHSHERTIECGGCRVVKPVSQMQKVRTASRRRAEQLSALGAARKCTATRTARRAGKHRMSGTLTLRAEEGLDHAQALVHPDQMNHRPLDGETLSRRLSPPTPPHCSLGSGLNRLLLTKWLRLCSLCVSSALFATTMDPLTAMLCERLDYWHPLRFVNLSGACATTKLLQLRAYIGSLPRSADRA